MCKTTRMLAARHLLDVCSDIKEQTRLTEIGFDEQRINRMPCADLSEVKGQFLARRALEIAAAAGLNLLIFGPINYKVA